LTVARKLGISSAWISINNLDLWIEILVMAFELEEERSASGFNAE